jgi:hypothetical protein
MRGFIGTVGVVVFALGIAIGLLGVAMIGWGAFFGPKGGPQAPEGSAPAFIIGLFSVFIGLIGVAVGRAIESASKPASPRVAAEQAVAADERHTGPREG